jgi:hypothetical protein
MPRYKLRTLLILLALTGFILAGLRTPTRQFAELSFVTSLISSLTSTLLVILLRGRSQAKAIGFLVFCGGYLLFFGLVAVTNANAMHDKLLDSPVGNSMAHLFNYLYVRPEGPGGKLASHYNRPDFFAVCHYSIALTLGVIGAFVANAVYTDRANANT